MPFTPDNFIDFPNTTTPITAARLNKLGQGVVAADITNSASAAAVALAAGYETIGLSATTKAGLSTTYSALDIARLNRTATRGYVGSTFQKTFASNIPTVPNLGTARFAFSNLPVIAPYTTGAPLKVYFTNRDTVFGYRNGADFTLLLSRDGGSASVQLGTITNWKGGDFSLTTGNAVVSVTCATDGTSLVISVINNNANTVQIQARLSYSDAPPTTIFCWGDSLTQGGANTYPAYLAGLSGIQTINMGIGGENSTHIAARSQTILTTLTAAATIPATGGVNITTNTGISTAGQNYAVNATISGIPGALTWLSGNTVFTRNVAGYVLTAPIGTPVTFDDADAAKDGTQVIWAGTNDVAVNYTPTQGNLVAFASGARSGRIIVLGPQISSVYPTGTAQHTLLTALATSLSAEFGTQFLDIRGYLISSGLAAAGITPTTQDNTDIANDIVPSSLRIDPLHLTPVGYNLVATQVWAKIQALGYER